MIEAVASMSNNILHVGLDVDDTQCHGSLWTSLHFGRYRPVDRIRLMGAPFLVDGGWMLANRVG